ncbi:MAG: caspase family protein [Treponema sp.]|nr:caspase family protein [Treponema sp.]
MKELKVILAKKPVFRHILIVSVLIVTVFFVSVSIFAQQNDTPQKFALVIGNSNYTGISRLANPVNDANDMEAALRSLGFTVDKVLNGNLEQMETAVLNFRRRLGGSRNTYGFFFFAGHGVQSNGENYLIPVTADNIRTETHLRDRAVSLQFVLDSMNEAGNELNMVVLDACRDNPFGWARSGSRGLGVVSRAPTGTIVMYATGANSTADDGSGRNGLFTGHLLTNLRTPGLSVFDVFDRTMGDVIRNTNGRQHPELSLRFAGATSAFLGARPAPPVPVAVAPTPAPAPAANARTTTAPAETERLLTAEDFDRMPMEPITEVAPRLTEPFIVLSQAAGWIPFIEGGNPTARNGTNANMLFGKEVHGGREVDVMTLTVDLARANEWRQGKVSIYSSSGSAFSGVLMNRLRNANGIRFSVLGDGGRGWRVLVTTLSTIHAPHEFIFNPTNGRIVNVDIPFSRLRQPSWVSQNQRVIFDRSLINGLTFARFAGASDTFSGPSTIKIFNFEIY